MKPKPQVPNITNLTDGGVGFCIKKSKLKKKILRRLGRLSTPMFVPKILRLSTPTFVPLRRLGLLRLKLNETWQKYKEC